jgi:hypothetical protein
MASSREAESGERNAMTIRTFEPGDEFIQVSIYNEACADLPKFKPATLEDVRRRRQSPDFEPAAHFYALENGSVVGYAHFLANGRVNYPWCRKGQEQHARALFEAVLNAMRQRGMKKAFAAYRADWTLQGEFFLGHGFAKKRDMVNFVLDLAEMPTPAARPHSPVVPLEASEIKYVFELVSGNAGASSAEELEQHLLRNKYFPASSCYLVRDRNDGKPSAVGVLIENSAYADPYKVDSGMPCFRLGAFGTEGMQVKRINGMFSFLARPAGNVNMLGLELLNQAARRLDSSNVATVAAQVPSDLAHLHRFYQQYFRRQGSFPVYEQSL